MISKTQFAAPTPLRTVEAPKPPPPPPPPAPVQRDEYQPPPPTSLRTEVLGDGQANCLEQAVTLAQPGDQVVLLSDSDGVGHAVVQRADGTIVDPNAPDVAFDNMEHYLRGRDYQVAACIEDGQVELVLAAPPGPQREALIRELGLELAAGVRVAEGRVTPRQGVNLGSNYTDLGVNDDGSLPGDIETIRANAAADLDRLQAAGITDVRVWVRPIDNPELAAARIAAIAELARARGMTVTVDLLDMHRENATDPGAHQRPELEERLTALLEQVVRPNARHQNIIWSVGNEPASGANQPGFDPAENLNFANWLAGWNNQLANLVGRNRVALELTPTAVGMPPDPAAMRVLVASAGRVNIHFYPNPDPSVPVADQVAGEEFQALLAWRDAASRAGKRFSVGEFGVVNGDGFGGFALEGEARAAVLDAWLQAFAAEGITNVRLWQLLKNEAGHVDGWSFDDTPDLSQADGSGVRNFAP